MFMVFASSRGQAHRVLLKNEIGYFSNRQILLITKMKLILDTCNSLNVEILI